MQKSTKVNIVHPQISYINLQNFSQLCVTQFQDVKFANGVAILKIAKMLTNVLTTS